jgi:hypothetical protein
VLGTYREGDVEPGHPLAATLAELARDPGVERLSLGSLELAAVRRLVAFDAGGDDVIDLAETLFAETEGNPFFIVEMLRHLAESGGRSAGVRGADIPEGVREVIARRVDRLGETTRRVLLMASILGRDFNFELLVQMSDLDPDELAATLERAVRARVVEEPARTAGHYSFTHALIRQTIYGELTATRRALLHRRAACALETIHAADLDAHLAELAHHFAQAGSAGDLGKAIDYCTRAGDRAIAQLAYEQAASHYRQAVSLIDAQRPAETPARRCDLVIAQGEAERQAGDPAYRATLFDAGRLARELGDPPRLARAALANNRGFFSSVAGVDGERVAALEDALRAHGEHDSEVHASLLAQLAIERTPEADSALRARLSDEALAMARRIGDERTLARTLNLRYAALWGPRTLAERLANTREASRIAAALDDPLLTFQAARFGAHAAMEAGDLALADRHLARARDIAGELGQPIIQWYYAVTRAKRSLISGVPAEAQRLADAAFDAGRRLRQPDAGLWLLIQSFVAALLRGSEATAPAGSYEPDPVDGAVAASSRSVPLLVVAMQAAADCEAGRAEAARDGFDELMRDDLDGLPDDWLALAIPVLASIACAHLRDARRARTLHAMLLPHSGGFVDVGPGWLGAVDHHLANLDATLGRRHDAGSHFEDAAGAYARLRADAWSGRLALDRVRVLAAP